MYCKYQILVAAPKTADDSFGKARADSSFIDYMYAAPYPALKNSTLMPLDYAFIKTSGSESKVQNYVRSGVYGTSGYPKITLAIIFEEGSSERDYAYHPWCQLYEF
jgi:hypothetical protein